MVEHVIDPRMCPTCHVTTSVPSPVPADEQLGPAMWTWSDPDAVAVLRAGELGAILRAYRRVHALTQEQVAARLGYDKTYVSMLETGRRRVQDVPTRRHIAAVLAIPPHLLGVTDPADSDHVAMLAFAESTIRLADLARAAGRAADAVNELWPLVARLDARAAEGHLDAGTLAVLGQAWTSLGICLGTVLPEDRLTIAAQWTHKGVAAAEHLDDPSALARALAIHGNELRKTGASSRAVTVLERAAGTATQDHDRAVALAFLARAAAERGDVVRFTGAVTGCRDLLARHGPAGPVLDPFTLREISLRGLLDLSDLRAAVALAETPPATGAPSPQWDVIERVTSADLLHAVGDRDQSEQTLGLAVDLATQHRMQHQIQRVIRSAHRGGYTDLLSHARTALTVLCSRPILTLTPHGCDLQRADGPAPAQPPAR